jgi:hypothetical protein
VLTKINSALDFATVLVETGCVEHFSFRNQLQTIVLREDFHKKKTMDVCANSGIAITRLELVTTEISDLQIIEIKISERRRSSVQVKNAEN